MLLLVVSIHLRIVNNEMHELMPEIVDDLCQVYQEQERTRALSLEISNLMLSSGNQSPREWVQVGDSISEKPQ